MQYFKLHNPSTSNYYYVILIWYENMYSIAYFPSMHPTFSAVTHLNSNINVASRHFSNFINTVLIKFCTAWKINPRWNCIHHIIYFIEVKQVLETNKKKTLFRICSSMFRTHNVATIPPVGATKTRSDFTSN